MVNVDLYSAIITKVSNALNTLVSGEKPGRHRETYATTIRNESVPKIAINDTIIFFCLTAISTFAISNHIAVSGCYLIKLLPYDVYFI